MLRFAVHPQRLIVLSFSTRLPSRRSRPDRERRAPATEEALNQESTPWPTTKDSRWGNSVVADRHVDEALQELVVAGGELTKSLLGVR